MCLDFDLSAALVLPNTDTNKNDRDYKQKYEYGSMRQTRIAGATSE